MKSTMCALACILFVLVVPGVTNAEAPATMSYQGVLTDASGTAVADGDYSMTFRIYNAATGGGALWEETQLATVAKGIFNVMLGSVDDLDLSFDEQYWLGISVAGGAELTPRVMLTSSAYSFAAKSLSGESNAIPSDGNAGIGTLSPVEKLDVAGAVKLGSTSGTHAGTIRWNGSDFEGCNGSSWLSFTETGEGLPAGSVGYTLRHNGTSWTAAGNLFNTGTNVGINTTNPTERLDVVGNARAYTLVAGGPAVKGTVQAYGNGIVSGLLSSNQEGGYLLLYDENGNNVISLNPGVEGGVFRVRRNGTSTGFEIDGNYSGSESPRIRIIGNSSQCTFSTNETGNASVILPTNAISSSEMLNEPGVSNYRYDNLIALPTDLTAIGSQSISIPAGGYVLVLATMRFQIQHYQGTNTMVKLGLAPAPDTISSGNELNIAYPSGLPTGTYYETATLHALFSQPESGTHTYYLLARKYSSAYSIYPRKIQFTCIYLPTAYGTITTSASRDGDIGTMRESSAGLSPADIAAQRAESEAANRSRIEAEIEEMRARLESLDRELKK